MSSFNNYITISEASKALGFTESNLRKHVSKGKFKNNVDCKKFGSTWILKKESIKKVYEDFPITLEERIEAYRSKYELKFEDIGHNLVVIEPKDLGENSNLLAYIPADSDLNICPTLVIDSHINIGFFRGYWIQELGTYSGNKVHKHENPKDGGKFICDFKNMTDLINYILIGSGCSERTFSDEEMKIVKMWFDDSMDIYINWQDNCYGYTLPEMK